MVEDACDVGQRFVKGAPRLRSSFALLDRLLRSARSTSYTLFSPCYTSFVAPHTKGAILPVLLFYA